MRDYHWEYFIFVAFLNRLSIKLKLLSDESSFILSSFQSTSDGFYDILKEIGPTTIFPRKLVLS